MERRRRGPGRRGPAAAAARSSERRAPTEQPEGLSGLGGASARKVHVASTGRNLPAKTIMKIFDVARERAPGEILKSKFQVSFAPTFGPVQHQLRTCTAHLRVISSMLLSVLLETDEPRG